MQRPALVTAIAYLQFLVACASLQLFKTPMIGKWKLFDNDWLSLQAQWTYLSYSVLLSLILTVAILRGYAWSRWVLVITGAIGLVLAIPVNNIDGLAPFVVSMAYVAGTIYLLFRNADACKFFSRSRAGEPLINIRELLATLFQLLWAFTIYRNLLGQFTHVFAPWTVVIVVAVCAAFGVLIGWAIRRDIGLAYRDFAITLSATGLFTAYQFALTALMTVSTRRALELKFLPSVILLLTMAAMAFVLSKLSTRSLRLT